MEGGKGQISQNRLCKMFPFSLFEVLSIMLVSKRFQPSQVTHVAFLQNCYAYRLTYPQLPMGIFLCYKSKQGLYKKSFW